MRRPNTTECAHVTVEQEILETHQEAPDSGCRIAIARCLLVRALRKENLHHAIAGGPFFIGIVVEKPADLDVFASAGRLMFRGCFGKVPLSHTESCNGIAAGRQSARAMTRLIRPRISRPIAGAFGMADPRPRARLELVLSLVHLVVQTSTSPRSGVGMHESGPFWGPETANWGRD
jgi:hypothetical protein